MEYLVVALVVILDQVTKYVMTQWLAPDNTFPLIEGFLHFSYTTNTGAAWGILQNARWVFMTISTLAIIGILAYMIFAKDKPRGSRWALALICGGGIGNMIDRIFLGYVVDFIDFRVIDFPLFNVADSCVCIGAFLFCYFYLVDEWKKQKEKAKLS